MLQPLNEQSLARLAEAQNIWVATVRPAESGELPRPHLTPVWFVHLNGKLYISVDPKSVKARNLVHSPYITLALEEGLHPLICEGTARPLEMPYLQDMLAAFAAKYEWNILEDEQYHQVFEITPHKWLSW